MAKEIERRWLIENRISDVVKMQKYGSFNIFQGYFSTTSDKTTTRFRIKDKNVLEGYVRRKECTVTIKNGSGLIREEFEYVISWGEANKMKLDVIDHKLGYLEKIRYEIPYNEKLIELDVYSGNLHPLIIAEVEFSSKQEAGKFIAPSWFSKEITGMKQWSNQSLAWNGIPKKQTVKKRR